MEAVVDDEHAPVVKSGYLLQLRVDRGVGGILQIIVRQKMVRYDRKLRLRVGNAQGNRPFLIALKNADAHHEAGNNAHRQHQQKHVDFYAPESGKFAKKRLQP